MKASGTHFKVECKIDGKWSGDDFVFPDYDAALAYQRKEESYGPGNKHRIVPTDAAVNLPVEDEAGRPSDNEDSSLSLVDWSAFFELSVLCPMTFHGADDGDLEKVRAQCEQGHRIEGRAFS